MAFLTTRKHFPGSINCYHKVSDGSLKWTVVYSASGYKFPGESELNILYAFSRFLSGGLTDNRETKKICSRCGR